LVIAIVLGGCGAAIDKRKADFMENSKPQDWGVLQSNHRDSEKSFILSKLLDPDSARFRFEAPFRNTDTIDGKLVHAWFSRVYVNAKNSFGGYAGEKPYAFAYKCTPNAECKMIDYALPSRYYPGELEWQR
jgi:hypothetical protein